MSISFIAGPLVGAVIGYFTNYLAVKMLFRPRNEIKIGGWTLPMTPGVIPKGKARLARAVGRAVSENLLTKEDMSEYLLGDETTKLVVDKVVDFLNRDIKDDVQILAALSEEEYTDKKEKILGSVCDFVSDEIQKIELKDKITDVIVDAAKEKINQLAAEGGMMAMAAMMLTEDRIRELADPMGWKAEKFIEENAAEYMLPVLEDKVDELENQCTMDMLNRMELSDEKIRQGIRKAYVGIVEGNITKVMSHFDIAGLIENKINAMSVQELEELVLSVMKNELNMIVSLGALIGLVIGTINIFI